MLNKYFGDKEFSALLFDFDGTVADTMPAHFTAWNEALREHKLTLTREQHLGWAGRPTRNIVELLNELHQTKISPDDFAKAKELKYMSTIAHVKEIGSVVDIIKHYHGKIPMAIVSGSRHKPVETTLKHLGLSHYFEALVCAEDYVIGKPAPDCFLQAAGLLGVAPTSCLVFEDADLGVTAAHAAGMSCLRVYDDQTLRAV